MTPCPSPLRALLSGCTRTPAKNPQLLSPPPVLGTVGLQWETLPGISPVVVHDCYGQVDLVNVLRRDVKDYGFIVNRIQSVPLGGCFPLFQSSAITHQ